MTVASIHSTPSGRTKTFVSFGLLAVLAAIYLAWSWTDQLVGLGGDNAVYVLTAQHYSSPSDVASVAGHFARGSRFPPLYPMALSLLGGANSFLTAHLVTTGFLLLTFAALLAWAWTSGMPSAVCVALVTAFALLPGTYTQTLQLHSENLYLLLTLLLFVVAARNDQHRTTAVVLGLLAAAATLTRTAGIALVAALATHLAFSRPLHSRLTLVVALLPLVLWNVISYGNGGHYLQFITPENEADIIGQLISRVGTTSAALQYGWLENLTTLPSLRVHCLAIGALCLCGCLGRAIKGEIDGIYVLLYLLMMLLWPFPGEAPRFVFVVVPILLFHGTWLTRELLSRMALNVRLYFAPIVLPIAVLIVGAPSAVLAFQRIRIPVPPELADFRRDPMFLVGTDKEAVETLALNHAISRAILDLRGFVDEDDCILAIKPSVVALLTQRMAKAPPGSALEQPEFERAFDAAGCKHALLLNMTSPTFRSPMYPWSRIQGRAEILRTYEIQTAAGPQTVAATIKINSSVQQD